MSGVENSPSPPPTSYYVGRFGFSVLGRTHLTDHPEEHVKPQGRKSYMGPPLIAAFLEGQEYHNTKGSTSKTTGVGLNCPENRKLSKSCNCYVAGERVCLRCPREDLVIGSVGNLKSLMSTPPKAQTNHRTVGITEGALSFSLPWPTQLVPLLRYYA